MNISRRQFLIQCGAVGLGFSGLRALLDSTDEVHSATVAHAATGVGYGELVPDPNKIFDLPRGFSYRVISRAGEIMSDGLLVPGAFDGMCAFAGASGKTILVRNHELDRGDGAFGKNRELLPGVPRWKIYDYGRGQQPGAGGTSTLIYDHATQTTDRQFLSLAGTHRNCAGGPTPWGSWITCEETTVRAGGVAERDHGYNFEVPASATGLVEPYALREMGRFRHEAIAVGANSDVVYQTEDQSDGLLYRFLPHTPGVLPRGGKLQMLKVKDKPAADTRNWKESTFKVGDKIAVEWLPVHNSEDHEDDLRYRGVAEGAARFARGEGMWAATEDGNDVIYFACTNGGLNQKGQIWRYYPSRFEGTGQEESSPGMLELFAEPNDVNVVEMADNLTIAPWGDIVICEDGSADQYLVGITTKGEFYKLGRNAFNHAELAGATFSAGGSTLFVNIYNPGLTLAITGPWQKKT